MENRMKPSGYKLSWHPNFVVEMPWESAIPADHPDYQEWLAAGNSPDPADPLPPPPPDWDGLYRDLIDPEKLLPLFQRIKGIAKVDLAVNASFTALIPTIATTKLEPALAAAIQELAIDLLEAGERLTEAEKEAWNAAVESRNFSDLVRLS